MSDNERGYHHRHAIDKGIAPSTPSLSNAMPPGILGAAPIGAGVSSPYMPSSSRPSRGAPQSMTAPHRASPHRYAADTERETVVITPRSRR